MSPAPNETPRPSLDVSVLLSAGIEVGSTLSASDLRAAADDAVLIPVRRDGDAISLIAIDTADGQRFMPAFSTAEAFAAWATDAADVPLSASTSLRDALGAARGGRFDGLVLDLSGAEFVVPASEFAAILGEQTVRRGETVAFGAPAVVDPRLLRRLESIGSEMDDVRSLTLAAMQRGGHAPELVVVAEHGGADDRLLARIADLLRGAIDAEPEVGVIDAATGLGASIRADLAPVFERA